MKGDELADYTEFPRKQGRLQMASWTIHPLRYDKKFKSITMDTNIDYTPAWYLR